MIFRQASQTGNALILRYQGHRSRTGPGNDRLSDCPRIPVSGGVDPRINGEQRVAGTTRCRAGRQDAASRQASSRLLRCAPALRVTRPNVLTHRVFMAGSELPATSRPICENTSSPEVNPHILCSPFIRGFSQPPTIPRAAAVGHVIRI